MLILLNTHPMIWLLVPQFAGCCRERCVLVTGLLKFYLILSFGIYSSVFAFCLTLCWFLRIRKKEPSLPVLKEWPCVGGWTLSFNPALALGCPSNLCDRPSSLFHISWLPWVEGMPRPVSGPKGRISVSTWIHADWKPDPQAASLKLWKYRQSHRTASVSPTDHPCQGI